MAPFEKAPLRHIPNVDILGAPPLLLFVNRRSLRDYAVSSSLRAMNVSHASVYFFTLFVSFLIICLNDRWQKWTFQNSIFSSLSRQYLVNVLNALTRFGFETWLIGVWGPSACHKWE